jgi:hypothetical protein
MLAQPFQSNSGPGDTPLRAVNGRPAFYRHIAVNSNQNPLAANQIGIIQTTEFHKHL